MANDLALPVRDYSKNPVLLAGKVGLQEFGGREETDP